MKAVVAAFNQEKALVGTFYVIILSSRTFVYNLRFKLYCTGHRAHRYSVCDHVEQDTANKSRILPRARTAIAGFYDILSISRYLLDNIKWPN